MTWQGVGIQDGIGKSEWWWFRLEIWGGNNKRKHWAKVQNFAEIADYSKMWVQRESTNWKKFNEGDEVGRVE